MQREAQTPAAQKLDHLNTLSRNALELLASRFEIERPHRLSDTDLQGVLSQKAEDYHRYRAEIEAIDERTKGLGNLKAAAEEAAERLDFEAVEDLLLMVEATETEIAAQTKVLRARNALLRGKAEHAFTILSAAAESFGSLSPLAPSEKRNAYFPILYNHGLRYGGPALPYAISLLQTALEPLTKESNPALWAETKNNLAATLGDQAMRTEGAGGAALLDEAVTAYNNALTVRTKAEHPVHWAETMENLAILEEARAQHPACETPRGHLEAALAHVEAALTVFDPVHMAYNHGTASRLRGVLLKALSD